MAGTNAAQHFQGAAGQSDTSFLNSGQARTLFSAMAQHAQTVYADMFPAMRMKLAGEAENALVYFYALTAMEPCRYMQNFAEARADGLSFAMAVQTGLEGLTLGEFLPATVDMNDVEANLRGRACYAAQQGTTANADSLPRQVAIEGLYALEAYYQYAHLYDCVLRGTPHGHDRLKGDLIDGGALENGLAGLARVDVFCPETDFLQDFSDFLDGQIAASDLRETKALALARTLDPEECESRLNGLAAEGLYRDLCGDIQKVIAGSRADGSYVRDFAALCDFEDGAAMQASRVAAFYLQEVLDFNEAHMRGELDDDSECRDVFTLAVKRLRADIARTFPLPRENPPPPPSLTL